jgi:hypothetical protein
MSVAAELVGSFDRLERQVVEKLRPQTRHGGGQISSARI